MWLCTGSKGGRRKEGGWEGEGQNEFICTHRKINLHMSYITGFRDRYICPHTVLKAVADRERVGLTPLQPPPFELPLHFHFFNQIVLHCRNNAFRQRISFILA